ncbi:hypothetical protein [Roseovarius sp.]|uniref:hypothetical protein n=1 Tax=Roseovarius sp. TaxID=1486281 RepID=UPI003A96EFFC
MRAATDQTCACMQGGDDNQSQYHRQAPTAVGVPDRGGIILDYAVRKSMRATKSADRVYQSDHVNRWTVSDADGEEDAA